RSRSWCGPPVRLPTVTGNDVDTARVSEARGAAAARAGRGCGHGPRPPRACVPGVYDPRTDVRNSPTQPSSSRPTSGLPPTFAVLGRGTRTWWTAGLITEPG